MTDQQIRLHFGELNAAEMRLARAIVGWHERQIEELKRWKAEAQAVEAEWNPQELAKMLGASLGQSCRQVIQKRVPEILAEQAKLRAAADGLSEALENTKERLNVWFSRFGESGGITEELISDEAAIYDAEAALAAYQATKP